MIAVSIDDSGFRRLVAQLTEVAKPEPILRAIGLRQLKWIDDNFKQEGTLSVGGWQSLKESTLKRRRGGEGRILQDTGRLKGSFETLDFGADYIVVGSRLVYASTHNFGRGGIPARRMIPTKEQAKALAVSVLSAALKNLRR
jgi:phage gpG-like protein